MKSQAVKKQVRKQYSPEFRKQALVRADQDGVAITAKELGVHESQLYAWRAAAKRVGLSNEEERLAQSDHARLKREVARLEQENAFLKKAAAYFAKLPQ
jgi:transposase